MLFGRAAKPAPLPEEGPRRCACGAIGLRFVRGEVFCNGCMDRAREALQKQRIYLEVRAAGREERRKQRDDVTLKKQSWRGTARRGGRR